MIRKDPGIDQSVLISFCSEARLSFMVSFCHPSRQGAYFLSCSNAVHLLITCCSRGRIQNGHMMFFLIRSHFLYNIHTFFKKSYQLCIDTVNFFSACLQIFHLVFLSYAGITAAAIGYSESMVIIIPSALLRIHILQYA